MTEFMRIVAMLSVLLALAGAWACHLAGKHAPHPRALAWHSVAVLLVVRAANTVGLVYAPGWYPVGQFVNAAWMGALAVALSLLGRTFVEREHADEDLRRMQ